MWLFSLAFPLGNFDGNSAGMGVLMEYVKSPYKILQGMETCISMGIHSYYDIYSHHIYIASHICIYTYMYTYIYIDIYIYIHSQPHVKLFIGHTSKLFSS